MEWIVEVEKTDNRPTPYGCLIDLCPNLCGIHNCTDYKATCFIDFTK